MVGISKHRSGVFTGSVPQLFVRGDPLEMVFDDVGVSARAAELEVGAGPSVLEAVAGVAVEGVAPTGVEHGLGEFPQLRPQFLELVAGDVEHLAVEHARLEVLLLEPLLEIALSLALGAAAGYLLNLLEVYFHSRSKRMSLSVAFVLLTVGLSMTKFEINGTRCGFSLLLVCMMTGTVFCNVCPTSDELMDRLDRWVSPINILFFVLSGAELDLTILTNPMVLLIGVVYIVARSAGKISGSYLSCRATSCSPAIQKYLGITLLPQAGVALGMAATAAELSDGHMVRNVVLFSVLVYELVGPTLTKISLTAAGEIRPEGRTSARVENQPEAPVELS